MASNLNEPQPKSGDQRSARRRLIKGSFAAPAALTLCSGSAIAGGSISCVGTAAAAGNKPSAGAADTWFRIQAIKNTANNGKTSEWITYAQLFAMLGTSGGNVAVSASNGTLNIGEALCLSKQNPAANGTVNQKSTWPVAGTNAYTGSYYAVLISNTGNIVGISTVTTVTGGAVSNGCWQSFGGLV